MSNDGIHFQCKDLNFFHIGRWGLLHLLWKISWVYLIVSCLCEHSNLVRVEKRAAKTLQHEHRYIDIPPLYDIINIYDWCFYYNWHKLYSIDKFLDFSSISNMNELLPHPLLCNKRRRRTQERKPAHTGQCLTRQRYEIYQYFEIGPRRNWFISWFLWWCILWCFTDICGQIYFLTFWLFVFYIRLYVHLTKRANEISLNLTCSYQNTTWYNSQNCKSIFWTWIRIRLLFNKGVKRPTTLFM